MLANASTSGLDSTRTHDKTETDGWNWNILQALTRSMVM